MYNLYGPAHYKNATSSCAGMPLPVTAGGFGIELIIILIVCLLILVILILSVLAYKKRNRHDNLKEFNDDIRENIINYSDEGGGEGDMTGYDLSVLRMTPDGKPLIGKNDDYGTLLQKVSSFLQFLLHFCSISCSIPSPISFKFLSHFSPISFKFFPNFSSISFKSHSNFSPISYEFFSNFSPISF